MNKYKERMTDLLYYQVEAGKYKPTTQEDITKIEEEIKYILPSEYADFLLHYGGYSSEVVCSTLEPYPKINGQLGYKFPISIFFSAQPESKLCNLINFYHSSRGRVASNLLPIARNQSIDFVCLCTSGENEGKIYFWDRDNEEDVDEDMGEEPGYSNVYLLANSFDEFINSLEIDEDE
jgi:hypothetical protein